MSKFVLYRMSGDKIVDQMLYDDEHTAIRYGRLWQETKGFARVSELVGDGERMVWETRTERNSPEMLKKYAKYSKMV